MILDHYMLWADNLAHNGTPAVLDLGSALQSQPYNAKCFFIGHSIAGMSAFTISDGDTSSPVTLRDTIVLSAADANAGVTTFNLPHNCKRYVTIALTEASGGTFTAGIVHDGVGIAG